MNKLFVFTGAGISESAGISTFRDSNGLWNNHDISVVCDIKTWKENYQHVINFYDERRKNIEDKTPTYSHKKIAEWYKKYDLYNFTTNVDDLFEKVGMKPNLDFIHLHGNLKEVVCDKCKTVSNIGYYSLEEAKENNLIKHTKECNKNSLIKPNVVFFGEIAPYYENMIYHISDLDENDIIVVIGTSFNVLNFEDIFKHYKCKKINLNPEIVLNGWTNITKKSDQGIDEVDEIIKKYL